MDIPLRAVNGSIRAFAVVDDEDADWVNKHRWSVGLGRPMRSTRLANGRYTTVILAREVAGLAHGDRRWVRYLNGDRLDCRRENLLVVGGPAPRP